ncbi:MAG: efflux RND transporter permease subunit [Rhodothermaceae bacterium]
MSLSSVSIKRPVTVTMFFIGIAILGIFAFSKLGVDLLPNINLPHLVVKTEYPNAAPEEIEKMITEHLEAQIGTLPGIKKISSVSKEGISVIAVDFVWGTDMDMTILSLREKLDNVVHSLPREAERPSIIRSDPSASPIMTLALKYKDLEKKEHKLNRYKLRYVDHDSPEYDIQRLINLKEAGRVLFRRRLEQIEGVARAIVTGGLEREILIEADPVKMEAYGITFSDISNSLKNANINLPAGKIMKGLFRYSLRALGEFSNTDEIEKTIVKYYPNGNTILISDVAKVKENFKEREGLTRLNGSETVGVLVYKEPEANTVTIAQEIKKILRVLDRDYPDFDLVVVSDQSGFIEDAITNVKQEVLYGGILAIIVLFFFLGSLRNIFAIGITIPASLVLTVLLMHLFDINFNIISLGGIAVGVGMLLDNAIVVIENIVRYKESGLTYRQAAIKGAAEVTMPVITATATTIVVFLPLIFVKGIAGELFKDQSYAIAFSLLASIVAAITLIPMLVSKEKRSSIVASEKYSRGFLFISKPEKQSFGGKALFWTKLPFVILFKFLVYIIVNIIKGFNWILEKVFARFSIKVDKWMDKLIDKYEQLLEWALDHKPHTIGITVGLALLTVIAALNMKTEFIPESAQNEFIIEFSYPKGTSLKGNAEFCEDIEEAVLALPSVKNVVSNIGRVNEFDFLNKDQIAVNKTNMIVKIDSYDNYYGVQNKLRKIFGSLKGIDYSFEQVKTSYSQIINPSEEDIIIKVKNKNINLGFAKAEKIVAELENAKIKGLEEIRIATEKGLPGYDISVNREKCALFGLNIGEVSDKVVNLVKGNSATSFSDFDKKISIKVKSSNEEIDNLDKILNKFILSEKKQIPVKSVVDVKRANSFSEIRREDQSRVVYLYASITDVDIESVITRINEVISKIKPTKEEIISVGGANEEITRSFSALYVALLISVLLMYMILASEFESFLFPFIIIFSVPLGLIGGILLLFIFGESISIISLMGLIILVGIADNDAVVKVEFILRKRKEGLGVREAIIQAGRDRFRPIVMNSLTVMFGLIPMMIGIGAATQLRVSLSLAVVGGLTSATFLTLIFIPVLYTYLEKWSKKSFDDLVD